MTTRNQPPTRFRPRIRNYLSAAAVLCISASALFAQTTAPRATSPSTKATDNGPDSNDEAIVLSPFEVSEQRGNSYQAESTLAGNRLNTNLRDVGAAISVVTAQMLRDIGATSNETLLQYTTSTEVGNIYGNMANAGSGTQLDETSKFVNPNSNTRVRGLASADNTIDFFLTDIPWDSYNVDRIDFQRGPNAILFGLGSPAGIINAGTRTAGFRNKGEVEFRYDRFGSERVSLDINQVLIDKELAFRLDALNNSQKFQQKPAFQDDRRIYGSMRYEPGFLNKGSAHTTLRAEAEAGKINSNRPRSLTPGDAITPWFLTGTATGYNTSTGAAFQYNNLNRMGFNAQGLMDTNIASIGAPDRGQFVSNYNATGGFPSGTLNPYWQPWLGGQFASGYFGNPMAVYDSGASSAVRFMNFQPQTPRGLNSAGAIDQSISGIPDSRMSSITIYRDISKKVGLPGAKFGLTRNLQLSDSSIFDYYDNLIDGPNKAEWQNYHRFNVNLSQTFFNGDAGFEAAYDRQHYDNGQLVFMTDKEQNIFIDVIQTLPDGTPNPNFGRPFIAGGTGSNNSLEAERKAFRFTAFLKHDFDEGKHKSFLTRFLGRHTLTGLYSADSRETDSRNWQRYGTDLSYKNVILPTATVTAIDSSLRQIYNTIYLGPSLATRTTAAGANIPRPTALEVAKTGSIRVFDSTWTATGVNPGDLWLNPNYPAGNNLRNSTQSENPANYKGWTDVPFNVLDSEDGNRDALTKGASLNKTSTESQALVWQGYLWDGALVGMYGYRTDIGKTWTARGVRSATGQINLDPSSYVLPTTHIHVKDSSNSWSVVAHLSQLSQTIKENSPLDISLFYNRSENFQPLAGRVSVYNNALPAPSGMTKDMGFLLATKDGRYSIKVNKYETSVTNSNGTSGFNSFYLGQLWTDYIPAYHTFKYQLGGNTIDTAGMGDPAHYTYAPTGGQTAQQAIDAEAADVAGFEKLLATVPQAFFNAFSILPGVINTLTYSTPNNFSVIENNISRGYEIEFYSEPIRNFRLTFNASRTTAERSNIGDQAFNDLVNLINTALNTTAAGSLRANSGATAGTALTAWNSNFWASWLSVKGAEGNAVPELRKWRFNLVANYDFKTSFMKGINIGAGYRWQDKVIIGYHPIYNNANPTLATVQTFDLKNPYYGPAETNIDLWVGYSHRLSKRLNWRTQLNLTNAFKHQSLIPITVQPDGTVAGWRIAPGMIWNLTNTIEF